MAEKLSITLPKEMANAIKERVKAGAFSSTSEVLRTAVRAWLKDEEEHEERLAALKARVHAAANDPVSIPCDEAFKQVRQNFKTLVKDMGK